MYTINIYLSKKDKSGSRLLNKVILELRQLDKSTVLNESWQAGYTQGYRDGKEAGLEEGFQEGKLFPDAYDASKAPGWRHRGRP